METIEKISKEEKLRESMSGSFEKRIPGSFAKVSDHALDALKTMRFPTIKDEYWKYTRTGRIANQARTFAVNTEVELPEDLPSARYRLVFVNGFFDKSRSIIPQINGFHFSPFSESDVDHTILPESPHIFEAMNTAMPQDGYCIKLDKHTAIEDPVQVVFLYAGSWFVAQPRSFVELGERSQMKLTEFHFHTEGSSFFSNVHHEILVRDQAHMKMDILQRGNDNSVHLQEVYGEIGNHGSFTQNTFTLSGNWTRNNTSIRLRGEYNECNLNGFYIPNFKEHVDNHTVIDHEKPHCQSNELYRGVLLDKSVGVFNGKVFVRQDAQKTNAFQSNGNILVSDEATMNSKPELEIYADDVKCSHGSTTGQLDEDAMFYLRARGLSKESARKMLINAFAEDVLENLVNQDLRNMIEACIHDKLG